ncbi:MAG: hypothetical protein DRP09_19550 [Candidatus Thorarchaeota archaeon]|nr:MAG: hypothetical protein DRP09_19550 [Candidatus Thorarchaeota archaeon]
MMATDHNDNVPGFSNYGKRSVDLAAPGDAILSTFPTFVTDEMADLGFSTYYETIYGTSMATPHVAGACALVWAQHPDWTWQMVKATILNSVDKLASLGYPANPEPLCVTRGRLNLHKALTSKPPFLTITKTDNYEYDPNNPTCGVEPNDVITYTIEYANPQEDPNAADYLGTASCVVITDYLPLCSQLMEVIPDTGTFNLWNYTYTLFVFDLEPGDSGTLTLKVLVTEDAEPSGEIKNEITIESENAYNIAEEYTPVCCWDDQDIIYVDQDAYGVNAGTSWTNAYTNLRSALDRAAEGCGTEIWVAEGTYAPVAGDVQTFALIDGVALYGGFPEGGGDWGERNWLDNETILSGDIGGGILSVITAENIDSSAILDGFTITDGLVEGVLCTNASPTIRHNRIKENGWGIYCAGENSAPVIKNNWIYQNEEDGIYIENGNAQTLIRNNTIADNVAYGIYVDTGASPNVRNCILWGHPDPNDRNVSFISKSPDGVVP